ncbi:Uncharacterized protein conserved in bacteria [Sphingobacterium spiritivorum]|uniref:Lipid A deacylase LpxR family protein n=2 Tax=Sphingobacterium spiritivorum TaxID=258 RepID=D7VJC7_SPHSI|nr:hypothetical protein HMPREF0766_11096 [Sphingobacterium spiritivorum ATCC 33861]QQT36841.1 lipid A deacylase LpxR family protein [Sphingobacterium spiritivorum]SUJ25321.1 Uncharacterized protein conserved in bacteria [Sphingobacterium spiritivorum]
MLFKINRFICRFSIGFVVFTMFLSSAFSQERLPHLLEFQSDNDVYLMNGQDRYYTNGLIVTYSVPLQQKSDRRTDILSFQLGHQLYNGIEVQAGNSLYWDRPSTAYLFLNGEFQRVYGDEWVWTAKAEVNVIGKGAKGKEVQKYVHRLLSMYEVESWASELNTSVGADVESKLSKKIWRSTSNKLELSGGGTLRAGMAFSHASAQVTLRFGKLADYYTSHFTKTGGFLNTDNEYYLFYTPSYTYQLYNATIQGGPFSRDKQKFYEIEPYIMKHYIGGAWSNRKIYVDAGFVFNTKEGKKMYSNHQYGTIRLGLRF